MRRTRVLLLLLAFLTALLAGGGLAVRYFRPQVAPPAWENDYDVSAQPPEVIAPGTIVGSGPPKGWSHLVIKSLPRVKPSEIERIPTNRLLGREGVIENVAWMFTAFAADVVEEHQSGHKRYRLRAIGLGLGTNINGQDTVVTAETAAKFGLTIGPIKKLILETGYRVQGQARIVIHGPSFALLDTPVTFLCGTKNKVVRYRYALLVDTATGQLEVFCWRLGAEGGDCADLSKAVLLHSNTIDKAELIPDLSQFDSFTGLPKPNELTFGVDDLPPNRLEVTLPASVSALAGKTRFTAEEARDLEDGLRKLLPR